MLDIIENFYSPLSKDGYLTPLQRKKLREKRKIDNCLTVEPAIFSPKRKKVRKSSDFKTKVSNKLELKKKKYIRDRRRNAENKPEVNFTISNLFPKKADNDVKEKKFFKCRSPNHLEKAKFSMPLVLKRNLHSEFNDSSKDQRKIASQSCKTIKNKNSSNACEFGKNSADATLETKEDFGKLDTIKTTCFPTVLCVRSINKKSDANINSSPLNFQAEINSVEDCISEEISESRIKTENSMFEFDWPSDEVLKERERKARLECRKSTNVSLCLEKKEENTSAIKLFPVFQRSHACKKELLGTKQILKTTHKSMMDTSKGNDQMIIDAGQKEIGAKVCSICTMVYVIGSAEDEKLHMKYHHKYIINLKFPGWKKENIIGEYVDGRIIKVSKEDKSFKLRKIEDILEIAHKDLGFSTTGIPPRSDVIFIIFVSTQKRVAGCLVAEPIESACPVVINESRSDSEALRQKHREKEWKMENLHSSSKAVPALCGINRIWVASDFRRQKIASRMIDRLRCSFIYGHVVEIKELAFTDPTLDGRDFAAAYTKMDNFLVYK